MSTIQTKITNFFLRKAKQQPYPSVSNQIPLSHNDQLIKDPESPNPITTINLTDLDESTTRNSYFTRKLGKTIKKNPEPQLNPTPKKSLQDTLNESGSSTNAQIKDSHLLEDILRGTNVGSSEIRFQGGIEFSFTRRVEGTQQKFWIKSSDIAKIDPEWLHGFYMSYL